MSISDSVANGVQQAFDQLMNAGVEFEKKKRKRRTKAEIEAARKEVNINEAKEEDNTIYRVETPTHITAFVEWDKDESDDQVLPSTVQIPDDILVGDYDLDTIGDWLSNTIGYCHKGFTIKFPDHHDTFEDFCKWEIEKAHFDGKIEPDFDFRTLYKTGERIFFIRYNAKQNNKVLYDLTLRTIYPRTLVGMLDNGSCQLINFKEKDRIFYDKKSAMKFYRTLKAKANEDYDENTGKKKRKRKSVEEEVDIDSIDVQEVEEE